MIIACLDLEGVLLPEIWINVSEKTNIPELRLTTRDIKDYDYGIETGVYKAYFKDESSEKETIKIVYNDYIMTFTPISLKFSGQENSHKEFSNITADTPSGTGKML